MNRHGYEVRDEWKHVKLRAESHGLWSVVHLITGVGYGPASMKALKLEDRPTTGISHEDAVEVADQLNRAIERNKPVYPRRGK